MVVKKGLLLFLSLFLLVLVPFFSFVRFAQADTPPQVSATPVSDYIYKITVTFSSPIPAGNIVDIELHNGSQQKVWQYFTPSGGTTFSSTTNTLPAGTYTVHVGYFAPNWSSLISWYGNLATLSAPYVPTPTPTLSPSPTPQPLSSDAQFAQDSYNAWKAKFVVPFQDGARVVRPENNNDTVSEGMGYGMLLSAFANDQDTFGKLWKYSQKYLDSKGLMNWQIDSNGSVIGQGSATDADEDMAYALLSASKKWPGYDVAAKNVIGSILSYDVLGNLINPGDNWGNTSTMNPSYVASGYYKAFGDFTGNSRWYEIANATSAWLKTASNSNTGLVSDWLNNNFSPAGISWDQYPNGFYYDALRTPIRLFMNTKITGDANSWSVLSAENIFFSTVGASNLKSGYTVTGTPLTNYLDSAFESAYTAASQANPSSQFAKDMMTKLKNDTSMSYFGSSLRAIVLFLAAGVYK